MDEGKKKDHEAEGRTAGPGEGVSPAPGAEPEPGTPPGDRSREAASERVETEDAGSGSAGGGGDPAAPEQKLRAELDARTSERDQLQDQLLRLRADFENFRKRVTKEKADTIQYGNEALLKDLLPVIDNIERVLSFSLREQNWKSLQEGIELVLADMRKALKQRGLEPIEAKGSLFDPNLHEAVQTVPSAEADPNTVLEEFQKGYLFRGRLLRPAMVVVAVPPAEESRGGEAAPDAADLEESCEPSEPIN
ncbi:MAG: nucleotide exchange factor GrpE [bacterium]